MTCARLVPVPGKGIIQGTHYGNTHGTWNEVVDDKKTSYPFFMKILYMGNNNSKRK